MVINKEGDLFKVQEKDLIDNKIIIPENVKKIMAGAFEGISAQAVRFTKNGLMIEPYAFAKASIKCMILPSRAIIFTESFAKSNIQYFAFDCYSELGYVPEKLFIDSGLTTVDLPLSVKIIGPKAFAFCKNLEKIDLSNNINKIKDYAFYDSGLKSITIPEKCEKIGSKAFAYCKNLKEVILKSSDTKIEKDSFEGCPADLKISVIENPERYNKKIKSLERQISLLESQLADLRERQAKAIEIKEKFSSLEK